jgi:hypothetical protein
MGDIMSESMGGIISECPGDFIGIGSQAGGDGAGVGRSKLNVS